MKFKDLYQATKHRASVVIDNATGKVAAVGSGLVLTTGSAFAEVPTEVSTALTEAKADSLTVAGLALVIIIAIAAFKFMRRAV